MKGNPPKVNPIKWKVTPLKPSKIEDIDLPIFDWVSSSIEDSFITREKFDILKSKVEYLEKLNIRIKSLFEELEKRLI
jgi:hypothetical protein